MIAPETGREARLEKTVRLVFGGQLLAGRALAEVKAGLPALLKIPPEQVDALFCGQPVVIKRGLFKAELAPYLALLGRAGLQVRVEDEMPATAVAVEVVTESASPAIEEMLCPQCGARQPRRTLCRECGVDMPRFAAAQTEQKAEATRPAVAADLVPPSVSLDEELPPVFGGRFDGRLNRMRFFVYGLAMQVVVTLFALLLAGSLMQGPGNFPLFAGLGFLGVMLAVFFFGLRFSVQRLHDIGLTGWLVLLVFAPLVGGFFWLWLALWPGNAEQNQYGPPNPPNTTMHKIIVLILILLLVLIIGIAFRKVVQMQSGMMAHPGPQMQWEMPDENDLRPERM